MRRVPLLGVAALAGASVLLLSGCLVIKSQSATQLNSIGNVRLTTIVCASSSAMGSTCTNLGNGGSSPPTGDGQALVGYRIPVTATEPAQIVSTDTLVTLTPSPSYAAELQRIAPAPAGQKWVGYISQVRTFAGGSFEFTIQPEFSLQRGADGSPFQNPFRYRVVTGLRSVAMSAPSTRPVVCAPTLTAGFAGFSDVQPPPPASGGSLSTYCVDSPTPAEVLMDVLRTTRDLGVIAPATAVTGQRGQAAILTFRAKQSGGSTGPTFTISATTTLPGATAAPNVINHVPTPNQDAPISVLVGVPADAAAGTYDVTLKAVTGAGLTLQTRLGVGKLTVPAPSVGGGGTTVKKINARVRYRVSVGSRIRVLSMRALGAPNGAKIAVSCKNGNCRLARIKGTRVQTRTSRGRPVDITNIFKGQVLRPGVTVEVRITRKNFVGRFFRFTFTRTNVKTLECDITLAGKTKRCVRL